MVEIIEADKSNFEKIIPSFIKAFNSGEWGQNWSEESARELLKSIYSFPNFYGLVAISEGKEVGAVLGHVRVFNDGRTYYIDEFFIDPAYQKRGIAKNLYKKAIEKLREEGVSGAFFTTLKNSRAYDFYISQGAIDLKDSAVFYHPF